MRLEQKTRDQATTAPKTPLQIARSRWDEASRVTAAWKIVLRKREAKAWAMKGQPGELEAWKTVAAAEAQLVEAERLEVKASQDVAWEERKANQVRMAEGYRRRGGR